MFTETFDVEFNCLMNQTKDFFFRLGSRNTARQIRHICTKTSFTLFDNDGVSQFIPPLTSALPAWSSS